mmetsp:Transcript_26670/g.25538  ORF Transcript_26670/g.25538 Transcript_26670/m.25538 type:complete len:280 (-) Transcript_26670:29-868(-)
MFSSRLLKTSRKFQAFSLHKTKRNFTFVSPPEIIQTGMTWIHVTTGLPWWVTFVATTLSLRVAIFPITRFHLFKNRILSEAMPEIGFLTRLLEAKYQKFSVLTINTTKISELFKNIQTYFKGVNACLTIHKASILSMLIYPAVNIASLITFVYSIRGLFHKESEHRREFLEDGPLIFKDLTQKDSTYILPITASLLSYSAIEIGFLNAQKSGFKNTLQLLTIMSIPMMSYLPVGIFFYWIPSTLFTISQSFLLRVPAVIKFLKLPLPMKKTNVTTSKSV